MTPEILLEKSQPAEYHPLILCCDDSEESTKIKEDLEKRGVDYIPVFSDEPGWTPNLVLGNNILRGYGDIMLYYLGRRPIIEKPKEEKSE